MAEPQDRIAEIEARCEAAAPGPWEVGDSGAQDLPCWEVSNDAFLNPTEEDWSAFNAVIDCGTKADADFIAHARADIPFLLFALSATQRENDELKTALEDIGKGPWDEQGYFRPAWQPDAIARSALSKEGE